jgi:hypothetical protein
MRFAPDTVTVPPEHDSAGGEDAERPKRGNAVVAFAGSIGTGSAARSAART